MHYVYVLRSEVDALLYTGCTGDLRNRLRQHNEGKVPATQRRTPLRLIYYEACLSVDDAYRREKYLKTSYGKRYLKSRLRYYFTGQAS
jgi:putative endonuclease